MKLIEFEKKIHYGYLDSNLYETFATKEALVFSIVVCILNLNSHRVGGLGQLLGHSHPLTKVHFKK